MRRLIAVLLIATAPPALAASTPQAAGHLIYACAATGHGRSEMIAIHAHPDTKTITALFARAGTYVLRDMPADMTAETLTFVDQQAKWSLDRASLTLTRDGDPIAQQCSPVTEQGEVSRTIF
jgi:hypothetical protein